MKLSSSAFFDQDFIPTKYTAEGPNLSPPLNWEGIPKQTHSLALICEDPDAPNQTYDHWLIYNIPPTVNGLEEGIQNFPPGAQNGVNSAGTWGYVGPNPPRGIHRYYFTLYALDVELSLSGKVTKAYLLKAMQGHILAETTLMGHYKRKVEMKN